MRARLASPLRFRWNLTLAIITLTLSFHAAADEPAAPTPEKIALWPDKAPIGDGNFEQTASAAITVHRPAPDKANGAAVVICPGGGYGGLVTGAEGHGIAKWLNSHGVSGVVLEYRLPRGRAFVPLFDAQRALRIVRTNAKDWKLNPDHIGIAGFSAGGHLASTAGTHFDPGDPKAADAIDRASSRPDFMILVYPVIVTGEGAHRGSVVNLLGNNPTPEMLKLFSNEQQVTDQTPPTFIASAKDDTTVPSASNSGAFYAALKEHKVAAQYLELPHGGHGLNGYQGPMWDAWQTQSLEFLAAQGFIPKKDAAAEAPTVPPSKQSVQGTWIPTKAELGGRPMPDAFLKSVSLNLNNGNYEVLVGDQPDKGTYTLDSTSKPLGMTIKGTEGPNAGKTFPAIYELDRDTLRICYDLSGEQRPTEFKSAADTKLYLVSYSRKKE